MFYEFAELQGSLTVGKGALFVHQFSIGGWLVSLDANMRLRNAVLKKGVFVYHLEMFTISKPLCVALS